MPWSHMSRDYIMRTAPIFGFVEEQEWGANGYYCGVTREYVMSASIGTLL